VLGSGTSRTGLEALTHILENTKKKKIHVRMIVCEYIYVKICAGRIRELAEWTEHHEK